MTKKIPEIRFAGFSGEWDKKRIGDGFDIVSGGTPDTSKTKYWSDEGINWFTPTEVNKRVLDTSIRKISQEGLSKSSAKILPKDKTVLYTSRATIGLSSLISQDSTTNQGFQSIVLKNDNYNIYFVYTLTHKITKKARKLAYGSTFLEISNKSMKSIIINFPDIEEQEKIGRLFEILDDLIEGQEEVVEKSKDLKKSFLQKLLPKEGASQPELRFPGFGGDYKTFRLKDISKRITRKNTNNESKIPLTISAEDGIINQNLYYNNRVASKDLSNYYLIKKGEFAYNKSYSKNAPLGAIKKLEYYDQGALSSLYIVFDIINQNKLYMSTYFDSHHWHKEIYKVAAEGARNHGLLNIGVDDFFDIKIKLPSLAEQEKIGSFFKSLDEKIEREEDRLEAYKGLKKSLLQKMFV